MTPLPTITLRPTPAQCVRLGVAYQPDGYHVEIPADCPPDLREAIAVAVGHNAYPGPQMVVAAQVGGIWLSTMTLAVKCGRRPVVCFVPDDTIADDTLSYLHTMPVGVTWDRIARTYDTLLRLHLQDLADGRIE